MFFSQYYLLMQFSKLSVKQLTKVYIFLYITKENKENLCFDKKALFIQDYQPSSVKFINRHSSQNNHLQVRWKHPCLTSYFT